MRRLISFLFGLIVLAAVIVLVIFSVENLRNVQATFLGNTVTASLWWFIVGSTILGFLIAFLLLTPGRVAAGWRGRTLSRQGTRLQEDLTVLRAQHEQLRAQHEQLRAEHEGLGAEHVQTIAERDRLRSQLAAAATPMMGTTPASAMRPATGMQPAGTVYPESATRPASDMQPAGTMYPANDAQPAGAMRSATDVRTANGASSGTSAASTLAPAAETTPPEAGQSPTLGGRLRDMFRGPQQTEGSAQDQTYTPEGPAAPTV